ncbi:MAG TPA: hypothetical protein VHC49_13180 [Mycobacteriales bacterium]|nr:hypothetical protein [Mycobacteriales bacterium]
METIDDTLQRLTEARMRAYHPIASTWQDPQLVWQRMRAETADLLTRTAEPFGRQLMAHFPQAGAAASDYQDAVIRLPDGRLALAGIRFRGGDASVPFVDIAALEGEFTAERIRDVAARWARFAPVAVRLQVPPAGIGDFRIDQRIVAGPVAAVSGPDLPAGVSIEVATGTDWYERYQSEYDRFLAADTGRREWTQPETEAALADSVAEGAVFLISRYGEPAGVFALPRRTRHGLAGFQMQEKFLFASARGIGLAATIENAIIRRLPGDVVFGSIADGNLASRRAAYRVGRTDIAATLWLSPPAGQPPRPGSPRRSGRR